MRTWAEKEGGDVARLAQVDLSALAQGSLSARRYQPTPEVTLRIKLD